VRYRAARSAGTDSTSTTTGRDLVPTKVAAALWDRLMKYKTNLLNFPQVETCELIIVDRSIDPIAAVIHEWTYDAMCHDLLDLDGNKYIYEVLRHAYPWSFFPDDIVQSCLCLVLRSHRFFSWGLC
jgi:syntaxin-binding protein 1